MADAMLKDEVREYWDRASCGEVYAQGDSERAAYEQHRQARYALEPYIFDFARFHEGAGKDVLEIGVGMGADHVEWARARPRSLTGVDLTPRAVEHTRCRLELFGLSSHVLVDDAENLSFPDNSFDLVYSWGVLHHSPDTPRAFRQVQRVLRPGGQARIMIYYKYSIVGQLLWLRYGLLAGRPGRTMDDVFAAHLESPGTKAYTVEEARQLCAPFSRCDVRRQLCHGDLLQGDVGQRHGGLLLGLGKALWPRWFITRFMKHCGGALLIDAVK